MTPNVSNPSTERTDRAKKNILASFANKGLAIVISLLLVPITIDYLNPEQYGVWLTLSSIIAWISYFDIGLGHGFRNRFAEAKAKGDFTLARKYVTTTYATLLIVFGTVLVVAELLNPLIPWSSLLKVDVPNTLLQNVVSVLLVGVCIGFILNVATIMLSADQKPAASAFITTLGQGCALIGIYALTRTTQGNMEYIAISLSCLPCLVVLIVSLYLFAKPYKEFSPTFSSLDFGLVRKIIGLGGKYFVIQISMLLIFQMVNIILSRVCGPTAVSQYNVAYKYFSITLMIFNIILSPFWSAFTEAHVKGDIAWMTHIHAKLVRIWWGLLALNVILLIVSPFAFYLWLGDSIEISWPIAISMMVYVAVLSYSHMYMIMLNGIGKVLLQMIIYICCACLSSPLCFFMSGKYGIPGVLIVLTGVYAIQAIFARVQLQRIFSGTCTGIMNK